MEHRLERTSKPKPYDVNEEPFDAVTLPHAARVVVERDVDALIDAVAADLLAQAKECVRNFGDFHLALSGGSTPEPLYRRLMYDPMYRLLPWKRTHLWIVDERRVDFDHAESNFGMIRDLIVEHADIPPEQVHPIDATARHADRDYEREIAEHLAWREKGEDRLDFILLGMGADGHTASLFPFSEALDERERLMRINEGGETPRGGRVTMTYPLINAARFIAVLVTGERKAAAIERLASGGAGPRGLPIAGVQPAGDGALHWYLDDAAAGPLLWNSGDGPPVLES